MPTNNAVDLTAQGTVYYNGTGTFSGIDGSTSGKILLSNGTGVAPSFQTASTSGGINGFLNTPEDGTVAASTTYNIVNNGVISSGTSSTTSTIRYYIYGSVTINKVYGIFRVNGTLASAGSITVFIRVNDTTNTNITTSLAATSISNLFNNTSLGISLSAGDFISFGFTTPAWVTVPTLVVIALGFSD